MADLGQPVSPGSPPQAAHDESMFHNPVLMRTREPARSHSGPWLAIAPIALAIVAGAAVWAYSQGHPEPKLVNHAVAAMPTGTG
ncbi:MAG TPA: hypothetical protein VHW60_18760 [Caulobacteraceae bacterium]|jgi:hypothetical protein|nr:hypothetical protein [Caulobacteraceae bacterium]